MLLAACAAAMTLLAGCVLPAAPAQLPPYRGVGVQPGDDVVFDATADAVLISISSQGGIGDAVIERLGSPPARLILRMQLKGLEELRLSWREAELAIHVSSIDGNVRQELALSAGRPEIIDETHPYFAPVRIVAGSRAIPLQGGYFEIEAPLALLQDAPERFTVRWIDFYR